MMRICVAAFAGLLVSGAAQAATPERPAVVELFTSQGCSSCPPANALLIGLADRGDVLALSFSVTYWDRLGWRDSFGRPEYTARQNAYARRLGSGAYTPEIVVDGRRDAVGSHEGEIARLIARSNRAAGPAIMLDADGVEIGQGTEDAQADVWLVRYDPHTLRVAVGRGENEGLTMPQRNVVRALVRLGEWRGARVRFTLPPPPLPGLKTAVLLQERSGGPILAAVRD